MVSRLIQKQNIRFINQRPCQCRFTPFSTRRLFRILLFIDVKIFYQPIRAVNLIFFFFRQTGFNHLTQSFKTGKIGLLRHIADFYPRLHKKLGFVRLYLAGNNFQQSRFAAAVAPHQTYFISAVNI